MPLATNLLSYYKMEGNSNDSVGSNNGSDTSISYSSSYGIISQGAGVNLSSNPGNGNSINIGSLQVTGAALSISAWCYRLSNITDRGGIVENRSSGAGYTFLAGTNNNKYLFAVNDTATVETGDLSTAAWHHIACVYDGTNTNIYADGVLIASAAYSSNIVTSGVSTYIGRRPPSTNNDTFNGYIDELGIWNRALSGAEVTQLYNAGTGLTYPFPVASSLRRTLMGAGV